MKKWNAFKSTVNNSYTYTVITASFSGSSTETNITVRNGVVTERAYTLYTSNSGNRSVVKTWTENSATLNTHTEVPPSLTIDEIYAKAKAEWLSVDKSKNEIYFEINDDGMISTCGYFPKGCQDDCFIGVNIKSITPL
ncbi:hypothetical protein HQ865_09375 [Mucilaginibacter mali]|uniref:Uncharacterized protein n=1 Tax=Mucilaginibacter mali TaxID=2740462 RepID=A0A7D4UF67_9SPHI|nr:hypothetical protein [Mucilaginibacter mali]QKJ29956.1 hypothetical protein HQ865_09375 [Mucilaginibacter mali]